MVSEDERRHEPRQLPGETTALQIGSRHAATGVLQAIDGSVVDFNASGVGVETNSPLVVGQLVTLWGAFLDDKPNDQDHKPARVVHCRLSTGGSFRAGCAYEELRKANFQARSAATSPDSDVDYYEVLQISPNASPETIQRVYRMLAQVHHPDNRETGNVQAFQLLLRAYQVLSDPEKRAKYDIEHQANRMRRWKIFDQEKAARGVEAEKRKRWGILSLLYTKRMENSERPGLQLRELEQLLGCPREHLEFAAWYLREQGLIRPEENARYAITARGVDCAEKTGLWKPQELPPLLEESGAGVSQESNSQVS